MLSASLGGGKLTLLFHAEKYFGIFFQQFLSNYISADLSFSSIEDSSNAYT